MKFEMKTKALRFLSDIQTGPFGSQLHKEDYVDDGTPIVTVEHLGNRVFTEQNLPRVSNEDKQRLSKYILKEGDIVFSRVGSVDRCSFVDSQHTGWLFSGRCLRVRPFEEISPLFLYYFFCLESTKKFMRNIAVGATMPSINTKLMGEIEVSYPDKQVQEKIANLLGAIDDKIELNNAINDNLEATIQAAFDKAFHDAGVSLPETIIKQNKVPQGWTDATVGDFASVQTGPFGSQLHNEDYVESGTPIITVEHMDGKYIAHRNLPLVSQNDVDRLRKYDLHTGDIVFSRVGSVDRAVMVSRHEDGWLFSGRCLRVRPYDPNTGSYFLWWFNQPVIRQLVTASAVGATMPSINTSILNSIRIVFPQKDIVTQFCKMADGLIEIIATNLEEIRKLNDTREYIQLSLSR